MNNWVSAVLSGTDATLVCTQHWCIVQAKKFTGSESMARRKPLIVAVSLVVVLGAALSGAWFYFMSSPEAEVTLPGITYSVTESDLGALLDYNDAAEVLNQHVPELLKIRQLAVARPLTLRDLQPFYPNILSDDKLAAVDAELSKLKGSSVVVYTTGSTLVGVLLDDPEARAIVDSYLPGSSTHPDIGQGRGFTLNFMQKFDREQITNEKLANMNADFIALAKSRAGLQ